MVEAPIKTALIEAQTRLSEEFDELQDQLQKQADRLDELRQKRDQDPGASGP